MSQIMSIELINKTGGQVERLARPGQIEGSLLLKEMIDQEDDEEEVIKLDVDLDPWALALCCKYLRGEIDANGVITEIFLNKGEIKKIVGVIEFLSLMPLFDAIISALVDKAEKMSIDEFEAFFESQ